MRRMTRELWLSGDSDADHLLSESPLALLVGMLLDQQVPMERAFAGPYAIARRLGDDDLDAAKIAAYDPDAFAELFAQTPAVHRFPGSMAGRVQKLCLHLVEHYDGDVTRLWTDAGSGADLLKRLKALPGFGEQKAKIFVALLGKQLGVTPDGWREAAGDYGAEGSFRSVADITGPDALEKVRETKKKLKAEKKTS